MKRSHKYTIALVAQVLFISSCCSWDYDRKEIEFSQEELNHFGPYKVGDTVYFESTLGDTDTIAVIDIFEKREEYKNCFMPTALSKAPFHYKTILIAHLPTRHSLPNSWLSSEFVREGEDTVHCQNLIKIGKFPLTKEIHYDIQVKDFFTLGDSVLGTFEPVCEVEGRTIKNCYKLTHGYPERLPEPGNIKAVYWTDKFGLTAYTNKSGETWFVTSLK